MAVYRRRLKKKSGVKLTKDWYVSYRDAAGRRIKKRIGPSKREAEDYLKHTKARILREEARGVVEPVPALWDDVTEKYLAWAEGHRTAKTLKLERYTISRLPWAGWTVSKITRADLEDHLTKRRRTTGASVHNSTVQVLRNVFKFAVGRNHVAAPGPAEGLRRVRTPPGRTRFLSPEERTALLAACEPRLRVLVEVALGTGLRRGELLALTWRDVDLRAKTIRVEISKNGERREVPMSPRVYEILRGLPTGLPAVPVFRHVRGNPWRALVRKWYAAVAAAKLEDFHFHDLRHTFASNLVMAGVDLRTVGALLGHKTLAMTMRYSHLSADHLRRAVENL
jgi:integrase